MNVKVNKLPKSEVELVIELSQDELKPFIEKAVKDISKKTEIKGFRPGMAPYEVLEKQVGAMQIYQEAGENAIRDTYPKAVIDNKLLTIGQPKIDLEKIAPENPFIYKARVSLVPEVTLGEYKTIKVEKKEVKVEDKDIEGTIKNIQKMFAKETKSDKPVTMGNKIEVDMDTYVDKVAIDGGQSKGQQVMVGEGQYIPGFEDNLVGMTIGQEKEFQLKFPKEYHKKDLAGKPVDFKVKVNSIFIMEEPPVDDALAKQAGQFETLADMKKQLEKNILQEKNNKEKQRWELGVIEKLISISKFGEIPEVLLGYELNKMIHELEHEVTTQGMKFEDYLASIKKSAEDLKKEFVPQAEKRIKTSLSLRNIASKEKVVVDDSEVAKEIEAAKVQYQSQPDMLKQFETDEYKEYIRNILRSQKVFKFLEKQSSVK
ncbi:MAG: trigger factor [Candidatus Kerfeldbacteria bacterium]